MKRNLSVAILLVLTSLALMLGIESYDRSRHTAQLKDGVQASLAAHILRLDAELQAMLSQAQRLADAMVEPQGGLAPAFIEHAARLHKSHFNIQSIVYVDKYKITLVYPMRGNESVLNLDYTMHPEFMDRINQMIRMRSPVVDGAEKLIQTGRKGLIYRAPIFRPGADGRQVFEGMVAITTYLDDTLMSAGLLAHENSFQLAIRSSVDGLAAQTIFGKDEIFAQADAGGAIALPGERWELAAVMQPGPTYKQSRAWLIRSFIVFVALLAYFILHRGGLLDRGGGHSPSDGLVSLRSLLMLIVLLPMPLLVALAGWLAYGTAMQAVEDINEQRVNEMARQLHDQVSSFFAVPRAVISYNAGLVAAGLLDLRQPALAQQNFLLQIRQQPLLTHLSIGMANGDFYSASRPPMGTEKGLRVIESVQAQGGSVRIYRVDDANQRSSQPEAGNPHFDARLRPWFVSAIQNEGISWYPAYRYMVKDAAGSFESMGMGMAIALEDAGGELLGVLTADVALSQMNRFLDAEIAPYGGLAFLLGEDGRLLASSGPDSIFRDLDGWTTRIHAVESKAEAVRETGLAIRESGQATGRQLLRLSQEPYLAHWQSIQLPNGPTLTLAMALPESHFAGPAGQAYKRIGLLILAFILLGMLIASFVSWWIARPLLALSGWARDLADGSWQVRTSVRSPVREVIVLARALSNMASSLRNQTIELERQVAERTQELVQVNERLLGLSTTDGLTGLANRRHFDEVLEKEWSRARRSRLPISLLMLDVDWFKAYNDHYGHPAGDEILRRLAQVLKDAASRPGDLVARYGGEEFAVILPGVDCQSAMVLAERIRHEISLLSLPHIKGLGGVVTVSIGVASMDLNDKYAVSTLLGNADLALYRAKAAGRNRVECDCAPVAVM